MFKHMVVQSPQWPLPVHSLGHLFQLIPVRHELFRRSRRHGLLDVPTPTRPREAAPSWLVIATLGTLARMAGRAQKFRQRHLVPHQTQEEIQGARSDCHHAVALKRDVAPRHFCRVISKENPRHRAVSLFHFQTFRV